MALPPDLDLNGYLFSHASVDARIYGIRTKGLKELAYKTSVEDAEGRGTAREALGVTVGDVKYEASATVLSAYWNTFKDECRAKGFAPLDRPGVISITVAEPGKASKRVEIKIARIKEVDFTSSSGPEAHEKKLVFTVLGILEDGRPLVSRSLMTGGAI